jgi:peptide/nickel transport system permease protein
MEGIVPVPLSPTQAMTDPDELPVRQLGQWGLVWRRFTRHRMAVVGGCLVLLMTALALLGPLISPAFVPIDPTTGSPPLWATHQGDLAPQFWPPHWRFLLGTDAQANPVVAYVLQGGRALLLIGILGALIASVLGGTVGSLAGYLGGAADAVLMRIVDAFLAVPFLLLLILFSAQLTDRSPLMYSVMFGLLGWPGIARLVRGYILSLREREFAEAARALGVSSWGVILRHLLPNALDVLVVSFTLNIAVFIVTEATLDFLGAGTAATTWGSPLGGAFAELLNDNWWTGVFPAIPITLTALAFNFVGDGLRDAFDSTSATALVTASQPFQRRKAGRIRQSALRTVHGLTLARLAVATSIGQARRRAKEAARAIPLPTPVRALGATPRVREYHAAPLPIRIVPIIVVTLAMGIGVLYGHSPLVYSKNYSTPAGYATIYGNSEYGAAPNSAGGWDVLAVDGRSRIAYERIDAGGKLTIGREIASGDDSSRPSLAERGGNVLGAWIGNQGQTVYAELLSRAGAHPVALNLPGGAVQNPDVVALRGGFDVLFGWQRPGGSSVFDIYAAHLSVRDPTIRLVRLVRSGDYALYPRGVADGSGHLDMVYLQRFHPGQWNVLFQRFTAGGRSLATPYLLGRMSYLAPGSIGCSNPEFLPGQWAMDLKRSRNGGVWAAWETGDDCAGKGINTLSVGHWSRKGKLLLPPTPVDTNVDASAQAVALALQGKGGVLYYPQPGSIESYMVATPFGGRGLASPPARVNYDAGGSVANPHAGTVAGRPVILWQRLPGLGGGELVGTAYHPNASPDLLTRLGLNVGNIWGNLALIVFGALGGGIAIALVNVYLLAPLIAVWLVVRRMPPLIRWPLFTIAIAGLLAYIFAVPATLPSWVLVMTALEVPYAWLTVAGAVFVSGWSSRYLLVRQESALRATAMALIGLYFVAAMYAVMYIEGQIGKI